MLNMQSSSALSFVLMVATVVSTDVKKAVLKIFQVLETGVWKSVSLSYFGCAMCNFMITFAVLLFIHLFM